MTSIVFDNVSFAHQYDDFALLNNASFVLDQDLCTIVADRQSGKTSLCRLLMGELHPQSGSVLLDGQRLDDVLPSQRGILYLCDNPVFFENKTVAANVAYPLVVRKQDKQLVKQVVADVLQQVGLAELANTRLKKLDKQTRQLVALARGLTVSRNVVLFDDLFCHGKTYGGFCQIQLLQLFNSATKVVLTLNASNAVGQTVVLDGGKAVFCGDASQAAEVVAGLQWITIE